VNLLQREKVLSTDTKITTEKDARMMIVRPLGPQGPKVGLKINGAEDLQKLDSEMEKLSAEERRTAIGIKRAARQADIRLVDFS
jgi:hypothetical protein